jgi:hypothetical protein
LTKKQTGPDESIFERVKHIVPDVGKIARALKLDHENSARVHKLLLITRAGMIDTAEQASQNVINIEDTISAQADLISNQRADMDAMEALADTQAGGRTVVDNQIVYVRDHVPTIRQILEEVNLQRLNEAAREVKRSRIAAIIDALLSAVDH